MDVASVMSIVTPILLGLLVAAGLWAVVEVAMTLRKSRETLRKADAFIEKADPLVERATLTLDAMNLEMMRVDGILEDVSKVTDTASDAAAAINTVANAPMKAVTGIVDALRFGAKDRARVRRVAQAARAQDITAPASSAALGQGLSAPEPELSVDGQEVSPVPVRRMSTPSARMKPGYTVVAPAVHTAPLDGGGTVRMENVRFGKTEPDGGHADGESTVPL